MALIAVIFAALGAIAAIKYKQYSSAKEEMHSEFSMTDIVIGHGDDALPGRQVAIHYKGFLANGTQFDSSYDRGTPYQFRLGVGQVIRGWDRGVLGMKVGGKRRITLPPELAYGAKGAGAVVPPNATLVYEVELESAK